MVLGFWRVFWTFSHHLYPNIPHPHTLSLYKATLHEFDDALTLSLHLFPTPNPSSQTHRNKNKPAAPIKDESEIEPNDKDWAAKQT